MSEDFEMGIPGENWWNPPRDYVLLSSSPCSTRGPNGIKGRSFRDCSADMGEIIKIGRSSKEVNDDDDDDERSIAFQDDFMQRAHQIDCMMDSTSLHMMGFDLFSASSDWNLAVLQSSGFDESSCTNSKLQEEDMASSKLNYYNNQEKEVMIDDSSRQIQTDYWRSHSAPTCHGMSTNGSCASYVYPSNSIQSSLEPEHHQHQPSPFNNQQFSGLHVNNFHRNESSFINASSRAQFVQSTLEEKQPSCPKTSCEDVGDLGSMAKNIGIEPAFKRPRFETPSQLPTFKMRKEKLGDRVTALQQLVSPFGKTDTASVLHEAVEYIKFLHDQVNVLCSPYMGNETPVKAPGKRKDDQQGLSKLDLRSRGLCLMPISSTFPVANSTTPQFWEPTLEQDFT
ncbi:transcription factor bHLH112-like isoform X1 [Syzygium oleosum]|uniref:transcription factor bHLH112-like isoform X1 n=1 Tax=Syzygium oleosum TaxID=219896 RepID=UPI0011D2B68A|nr:transcription factor bHLH112-like isoform X1 [Syzygium oleosum]